MIAAEQINSIATQAARANLGRVVQRVFNEPTIDAEGKDALRLTIVITPKSVKRLSGDALLDTLVQIRQDLQKAGDDRLAHHRVRYGSGARGWQRLIPIIS